MYCGDYFTAQTHKSIYVNILSIDIDVNHSSIKLEKNKRNKVPKN